MAGDHKCPVCQATFTRPQHVARHMRSHTGDRPYKCQHCGDQFARSDLLSRHINKCHASEKPPVTSAPNQRRKGAAAACRATTSKQACDQCVQSTLPCDGANPCSKCMQRKCRCTYVKFHRQTAPVGPGHAPPPRTGSDLDAPVQPYTGGPRYAQSGADYFPISADPATIALAGAAGGLSALYGSAQHPYAFNPQQPAYGQDTHMASTAGAVDQNSADFATRYRQQAELLRRAGVIPPASVSVAPDINSVNAGLLYNDQLMQNRYPTNGNQAWSAERTAQHQPPPPHAVDYAQNNGTAPKDVGTYDQYGYLQRPAQQQQQYYGYAHHSRNPSLPEAHARRGSIDMSGSENGSITGSLSSAASSNAHLPLDVNGSSRNSYASTSSRPSAAESPASTSSRQLPPPGQGGSHQRTASDGHHDGFSSAFGLMSLDDPAVLAGLASDAQPFFSGMGMPTPTPAKERERREAGLGPLTAREMETRELRDFWKQYMRTPLSGGGPLGGITPSLSSVLNQAGGILGAAGAPRPGGPKRGLSRVASLPSVKTPGIGLRESYAPDADWTNAGHGQTHDTHMAAPAVPASRTYTNSDDLKSYEAAVLSRKAPMNLNLQPRRARAGSAAAIPHYLGQGYHAHDSSASPEMHHMNAIDPSRPGSTAAVYGGSRAQSAFDPSANGDSRPSTGDAYGAYMPRDAGMLRPPSAMTDDGSAGSDTDGSNGAATALASSAARPGFKRLASQTLTAANAKRSIVGYSGAGSPFDGEDEEDAPGASGYEPQVPRQIVPLSDRYRRMSAPTGAPGLVEGGYA